MESGTILPQLTGTCLKIWHTHLALQWRDFLVRNTIDELSCIAMTAYSLYALHIFTPQVRNNTGQEAFVTEDMKAEFEEFWHDHYGRARGIY